MTSLWVRSIGSKLFQHTQSNLQPACLLPCSHQADIRLRSHRLLRLDDNKSAASCQQACCKLIAKTFTVVAMEVLIKYCINSFLKLTNSFDRKLINFLQNCSTSLLFVCNWSIRSEGKSNWLSG